MEFCPKCGSIILVQDRKAMCAKCNYKPKGKIKIRSSEKLEQTGKVAVIKEKELTIYPVVDVKCGKCKNSKAYFWILQTRSSDEAETKFYKCVKCEHTWSVYN